MSQAKDSEMRRGGEDKNEIRQALLM